MTTISAGAAAGLLVALMVMSTGDGHSAEPQPTANQATGFVHPGTIGSFNPQPDPPREVSKLPGDGSVRPVGH